jgi:hypothetical protein
MFAPTVFGLLTRLIWHQTADSARVELASALSQPGNTIRSLTTPQTIFLLTILRVESLRAEAGRPATILRYFDHEGINTTLLHPLLVLIANQVRFPHLVALLYNASY